MTAREMIIEHAKKCGVYDENCETFLSIFDIFIMKESAETNMKFASLLARYIVECQE